MADTVLYSGVDATITAVLQSTKFPENPKTIRNVFGYTDFKTTFVEGSGQSGRANLLYHKRSRLINATEYYALDGALQDVFGNYLNYDAVKILAVRNRQTQLNRFLEVRFKNERMYIGPSGGRILIEPYGPGIESILSSQSEEEGTITVTSNADVTYDIIIIGSSAESSSSGVV